MFKLFRTLCLLLGFWIATLLLSGAGVSFTHGYAAPKNLSHFVVSLVVVCAILLWTINCCGSFLPRNLRRSRVKPCSHFGCRPQW
ncbi:hypothetical protein ACRS8K_06875 [Serratia marcescens]